MRIASTFMATLVAGLVPSSFGQRAATTAATAYVPSPTRAPTKRPTFPPISYATPPPTTARPVTYATPPPTPATPPPTVATPPPTEATPPPTEATPPPTEATPPPTVATPPPTLEAVTPPPTMRMTNGTVNGDPHFKTWVGEKYDYHGICDLVLLQNPNFANGLGMHIHIRAKPQGLVGSYIETAVVRIGDNTLEVMGGEDANRYWIDGVEGAPLDESTSLSGYPIRFDMPSLRQREFTIGIGDSGRIKIKSFKHLLNVNVGPGNEAHEFRGSLGLMGAFDTGLRVARDGQRFVAERKAFGNEWQVRDTDPKLFHSLDGPQYPDPCTFPWDGSEDLTKVSNLRRRLSESKISEADAERACEMVPEVDRDDCIFDVLAMDDIDFAGAY